MASNYSSSAGRHLAVAVFIFGLLSQYQLEGARDSQFFSKVSNAPSDSNSNSNSNSNDGKEQSTQKDSSEIAATGGSHGLVYNSKGRSDQLLPNNVDTSTKSNDENYNYQTEQASELDGTTDQGYPTTYNDKAYVTKPQGYTPNNNYYSNSNEYGSYGNVPQERDFSGTSLMDQAGHSTTYNNNDNGLNTYNPQQQQQQQQQQFSQEEKDAVLSYNNNNYYSEEGGYNVNNNNNNNRYNGQQEGMSDTRFLENGRYHYNVKTNQYNNNLPNYGYSRNNNYDSINANSYGYSNNNNYNYNSNSNSMEGYQNQTDENEELDSFNP